MSTKTGTIVANWKMNMNLQHMHDFFHQLKMPSQNKHRVLIAPQAPLLVPLKEQSTKHHIGLASQNCSSETKGAYTGEISADVLSSIGVEFVILGHSERRQYFGEKEDILSKKIHQALLSNLKVIYCIGESLEQREKNALSETLTLQLSALKSITEKSWWEKVVIAYEPVWAIGTGKVATTEQVKEVHDFLQKTIMTMFNLKSCPPIIYGGSVNAENAQSLFTLDSVSGFLVGGASLKAHDFARICSVQ